MSSIQKDTMVKVKFVARLGTMGEDKIHVLVPKDLHDKVRPLLGQQVRVVLDDEI
jgi:hypothetical protein